MSKFKFRKNDDWGIAAFITDDYTGWKKEIESVLEKEYEELKNDKSIEGEFHLDIIDIDKSTYSFNGETPYHVSIYYAIVKE